jgi:hypothetical protein
MVKFTIDGKDYVLPNKMTIENYVKIFKLKDLFEEQYFAAKLIHALTGAPKDKLMETDYEQITYLTVYILEQIPKEAPEFKDRFELNGVHYGFFPKWQDLTFAEFVDMDTISTKKPEELLDLLHILCAVMYRPITNERSLHDFDIEKYDVKNMTIRAELFKKELDVRYVLGAQSFFTNFARRYSNYFQSSLIPKIGIWTKMKIAWKMRRIMWKMAFNKSTDGSLSSTDLLEMILQNTNKSTKRD